MVKFVTAVAYHFCLNLLEHSHNLGSTLLATPVLIKSLANAAALGYLAVLTLLKKTSCTSVLFMKG